MIPPHLPILRGGSVLAFAIVLLATGVPSRTRATDPHSFVESFQSTLHRDATHTSALWDTIGGTVVRRVTPLPMSLVGTWNGATVRRVLDNGRQVIAGTSEGFRVINVETPSAPVDEGGFTFTSALSTALAWEHSANFVLVGWHEIVTLFPLVTRDEVVVYDITTPASTSAVSSVLVSDSPTDLVLHGPLLLVGTTSGLDVVDVSDFTAPVLLGSVSTSSVSGVIPFAGHALLATSNGLTVVDLSNPASPTVVGTFGSGPYSAIARMDHHAIVSTGTTGSGGLVVFDVSNPTSPAQVGSATTAGAVERLSVDGPYVLAAEGSVGIEQLHAWAAGSFETVNTLFTGGTAHDVTGTGTRAFVADDAAGVHVVRTGETAFPRVETSVQPPDAGVATDGAVVYAGGLSLDVHDPANGMPLLNTFSTSAPTTRSVVVDGRVLVMFPRYDVSDPSSPVQLPGGRLVTTPEASFGNYVCAAFTYFNNGFGSLDLLIEDESGTGWPHEVAYSSSSVHWTDRMWRTGDLTRDGHLVVIASDGIAQWDVSDPTAPFGPSMNLTLIPLGEMITGAAMAGDILYVTSSNRLRVFQTLYFTLGAPSVTQIGSLGLSTSHISNLVRAGNHLILPDTTGVVHVVDVTVPSAPVLVSSANPVPTGAVTIHAVRSGDHLMLAQRQITGNTVSYSVQAVRVFARGITEPGDEAQSDVFASTPRPVPLVRLDPVQTPATGSVDWSFSTNGGVSFTPVSAGAWTYLSPGTDLVWHARLRRPPGTAEPVVSSLTVLWRYDAATVTGISDVPDDEGLQVDVAFRASAWDLPTSPTPVTGYVVFRRPDDVSPWTPVDTVTATGADAYQARVSTTADSTAIGGMHRDRFLVRAVTATPGVYWDAPIDSGYSVDNRVPDAPTAVSVQYNTGHGNDVSWTASTAPDVVRYRIYRGDAPGFTPTPGTLVDSTTATSWSDPSWDGWNVYYAVTAVDDAGQASTDAPAGTVTAADDGAPPRTWALGQNVPNPFNPTTVIRVMVPASGGHAVLAVYDVAGRRVRTLLAGRLSAGEHRVSWNGRDDAGRRVASGVYFYRLTTDRFRATRKMVLLQ